MTILLASAHPEFAVVTARACRKCSAVKSLDQFSRAPKGKYGRKASCKACDAARYAANPAPSRALPEDVKQARIDARRAAGKACTRCGQVKPYDQFPTAREGKHGSIPANWCHTCEDTEFIDDAEREAMAALGLVGQPCACGCGEMTRVDVRRKRVGKWLSGHKSKVAPPMLGKGRHLMEGTPTYNSWQAMWQRCTNPKAPKYARYGGRGISVCDRWRDFVDFLEDMGVRPDGTTLDRIDGDGNYEPGNCRWADWHEQAANRSNTKLTEDDVDWVMRNRGVLTQAEMARRLGVTQGYVSQIVRGARRSHQKRT